MTQQKQRPKSYDEEIQHQEIEEAIVRSGYPLEVRLLDAFEGAGMKPDIGMLFRPQEGSNAKEKEALPAREIDLVAHLAHRLPVGPVTNGRQDAIHSTLRLLVAAKNLAPSAAMVGFKWKPKPTRELQLLRCRVGGLPTTILDGYPEANALAFGEGGLADAFEPLTSAPICVQWSIARREEAMSQERRYWRDMDVLVRAESTTAVSETLRFLTGRGAAKVLLFQLSVFVVATRALRVYDPLAKKSEEVDWFTLSRPFDVGDHPEHRLIDVVTEAGLPRLIDACKRTMEGIRACLERRSAEVATLAALQHSKFQAAAQELALDQAVAASRGY